MIGFEIVGVSLVMRNGDQGNKKDWLRLGNGREVLLVVAVKIMIVVFVSDFVIYLLAELEISEEAKQYPLPSWKVAHPATSILKMEMIDRWKVMIHYATPFL